MLKLDHFFVCVNHELDIFKTLKELGFKLTPKKTHPGQGTANRCIFLNNAYIEFLIRDSDLQLQSESVQTVSLWERMQWQNTGASPFGMAFRSDEDPIALFPLSTIDYAAPFLPSGATIPIATPSKHIHEPLIFFSLFSKAPIERHAIDDSLLEHQGRNRVLTGIHLTSPNFQYSEQLQWFCERNLISISEGSEHHAELQLDRGTAGQKFDFRPFLPLSIRC